MIHRLVLTPTPSFYPSEIFLVKEIFNSPLLLQTCQALSQRGAIFVDAALFSLGTSLQEYLSRGGLAFELFLIPSGEKSKTREMKQHLEDELFQRKLGRDSLFIALGGGVTTDLIGYLASTYMRGVPVLFLPTTLLAMVDAAIGGKNGVDTPYGKNLIGTVYPPKAVFIDPYFLQSLPNKEWLNGLAEILKYGLIAQPSLWTLLETHSSDWKSQLEALILQSLQTKQEIVERDPEEKGLRRILNFGHTVGHALEQITHYQIAHGEAVALGCRAESYLSHRLGYLSTSDLERILALFKKLGCAARLPRAVQKRAFLEALTLDKKAKKGLPRFVVIDQVGHCLPFEGSYCTSVSPPDLEALFTWMENG